ncbi:hypothetical protein CTA1_9308 [Colletotrichum tanaceti]|uniref:Uncharacterized protein n=1 Tax=Colletotrichum tanaceti TaxID=1306861 RepID=A0A4U6XS00_9PEZI|nr:hypothetical protein CTA1_9308 [Colletotrichum tanaceti]
MEQSLQKTDYRLLQGCCLEAERADIVSISLEGLRMTLPESYGGPINVLVGEMRKCARLLRDLFDLSQMHFNRVPILSSYLQIVLPCLCKTLRDISSFYNDRTVSKDIRWRKMYHKMSQEAGGLPLPQRFTLYNNFLDCLRQLLIMPFDEDRLALKTLLNPVDHTSYIFLRTYHLGVPWFSFHGTHELVIGREDSCLQLKRWSVSERAPKIWASLSFKTWEELTLFHCTFVSLKARNTMTVDMNAREFKLSGEKKTFQAQIIDDGYQHSLVVYQDIATQSFRLHAMVWDGVLRLCPVWTAFVTHQSASPTWLQRKSRNRVWLKDIHLYVFCQEYRQQNQRKGDAGAFEISFVSESGAALFPGAFSSAASGPSTGSPQAIEDAK